MDIRFFYSLCVSFLGLLLVLWHFWAQRHQQKKRYTFRLAIGLGFLYAPLMFLTNIFFVAWIAYFSFGMWYGMNVRKESILSVERWWTAAALLSLSIFSISLYLAMLIAPLIGEYIPAGTAKVTWVFLIGVGCFLLIGGVQILGLRKLLKFWKRDISA
jgi:hypothetical protein